MASLRERLAAQRAAEAETPNPGPAPQPEQARPQASTKPVMDRPTTADQIARWLQLLVDMVKRLMTKITGEVEADRKALRKARTKNNLLLVLVLLPLCFIAFWYYVPLMALFTGIDKTQIHDLGVEALQPVFVGMIYVVIGAVFSLMLASFIEPQLRDGAFGTWSKFGILFCLLFFGFCMVVQGLM